MKLSFVIPAYNEEFYIGQCLASVLREISQNNYNIEVIVVNNASTDQTALIASSFAGVKVINEPRKGITYARQAGFLASTGDLIANIDADTILPIGWLATVFQSFNQRSSLVALSGPFIYFDASSWVRFLVLFYYYLGFLSYLLNRFVLQVGSMLQGGNFIVRREALQKSGGHNTALFFYGEDLDLACRLCKIGEVKFTFDLPMYASARRLQGEGLLTMACRYAINYFWTIFFNRPFTKKYVDIRFPKD